MIGMIEQIESNNGTSRRNELKYNAHTHTYAMVFVLDLEHHAHHDDMCASVCTEYHAVSSSPIGSGPRAPLSICLITCRLSERCIYGRNICVHSPPWVSLFKGAIETRSSASRALARHTHKLMCFFVCVCGDVWARRSNLPDQYLFVIVRARATRPHTKADVL